MKNFLSAMLALSLMLTGCAVKTNPGMTMTQLNNAAVVSGNGNLVLVSRAGDFEIYQSSAVLDWKKQISQGNAVAKSILTPDKNVYYVIKGGVLHQEIVGDAGINAFITKVQPPAKQASSGQSTQSVPAKNPQNSAAQDRQLFGMVDDFNTRLIDQSSAARRLSSCIGIMKGAQFAANSISQPNLSITLAQQQNAFYSFGANRMPPVDTYERMMLDGAMRDAQSGAEGLSRNNQQALVFKIANNCKGTLGAALKN